jgi:hypothetical protein
MLISIVVSSSSNPFTASHKVTPSSQSDASSDLALCLRPCKCARANYHELPLPLHPRTPPIHHHSPTHKHISISTATHPALVSALAIIPKSSFSSAIRPRRPTLHHPPTDDDRSTLPSPADLTCYQRHRHFSRAYYQLTPHE